jgi:hypothetical protein
MSKPTIAVALSFVLCTLACGSKPPAAAVPSGAADKEAVADLSPAPPSSDEAAGAAKAAKPTPPSCDGLDEKKCKITAGCAWSDQKTCLADKGALGD